MHKKIGRKIYDTDQATEIGAKHVGFYGDPAGYEEKLFKKGAGDYFLFGQGGPHSQYSQPDLTVLDLENAKTWLTEVAGTEAAAREFAAAEPIARKTAAPKAVKEEVAPAPVEAPKAKAKAKAGRPAKKPQA